MHVVLATGGAAVFIYYFILRSPSQKGDKMPRIFKFGRRSAHPAEETSPHTLKKVEGVETRPQKPWQLPAHDQSDLCLKPLKQLARSPFIASLNSLQKIANTGLTTGRALIVGHHQIAPYSSTGVHPVDSSLLGTDANCCLGLSKASLTRTSSS